VIGRASIVSALTLGFIMAGVPVARAHSGPPYPAVSNAVAGAYTVAIWTDPDTTDDGSAQGKFWVTLQPLTGGTPIDPRTRVDVAIEARRSDVHRQVMRSALVKNDPATFYAALPMAHEGAYAVHVSVDGPAGPAQVDCEVQATYDLRPAPALIFLYVMPFLLVALLWAKLLLARRRARTAAASGPPSM
jgi:hypothetical protein